MSRLLPLTLTFCLAAFSANAQTVKARLTLRNNSLLPRNVTIITYQPSTPGNGTTGHLFGPKKSKSYTLEVGTKVYLANADQVDYVMSGKLLPERGDEPFCTVEADENTRVRVLP